MGVLLSAVGVALVIVSLYAGPVFTLVVFVLALTDGPRHRAVMLLASAGAVLCGVWIVLSARAGIRGR